MAALPRPGRFRAALGAALLVGLFLQWPSLGGGFRGDDYAQYAMFRGAFPAPRTAFDLFSFAAGTRDDFERLVAFGHLPWWTDPQLRLRMWRPLASALIALDFSLFDRDATLAHAHSLLWFTLLLWAAGRVLFRCLSEKAATLSLLLFASAPCHTLPTGWLANRSSLVGSTFAFLALECHLTAGTRSWRKLLTAGLTSLALLAGEYGLVALAYLLCFQAFATPGNFRARLHQAWPVLVPLGGYLAMHTLVGSDVRHSGYYIGPLHAPWAFAQALLTRVPVLIADLLLGLPAFRYVNGTTWGYWFLSSGLVPPNIWLQLPAWNVFHVAIGYGALALALVLWRVQRRLPATERAPDLLLLGAAVSLVPCAGSLPEDRLLIAASLGATALVATVLTGISLDALRARSAPARAALLALWLIACWAAVSGGMRSYADVRSITVGNEIARAYALDADMPAREAADAHVYLVTNGDFNTAVHLPWLRWLEGKHALPRSYRRLSPSPMPVVLTRESDRAIDVNVVTSNVYGSAVPSLYRDTGAPVRAGEQHTLPGLRVEVLEVAEDNPVRMRFEFDRSLDDETLWFLFATDHGLRRQRMPAIGESVRIPYAQYPDRRAAGPAPQ